MQVSPLTDEPQRSQREIARLGLAGSDVNLGLVLAIAGMEVRGRMVAAVHADDDSIETADAGHRSIMRMAWDGTLDPHREPSVSLGVPRPVTDLASRLAVNLCVFGHLAMSCEDTMKQATDPGPGRR